MDRDIERASAMRQALVKRRLHHKRTLEGAKWRRGEEKSEKSENKEGRDQDWQDQSGIEPTIWVETGHEMEQSDMEERDDSQD